MKIAIVTDSSAYLTPGLKMNPNLHIIPIPVILDGKIYNEDVDVSANGYYELLKSAHDFPKTSQPAIGEVLTLYENLRKTGVTDVISIHLSSGISGFVDTLSSLKDEVPGINIHPFDSKITSVPMGYMVEKALFMAHEGASVKEILSTLKDISENTRAFMIVDDLGHLVRGGRLKNGAALIGGLLKIKPVLQFKSGKIVVYEKIRTSRRAFNRVEDLLLEKAQKSGDEFKFFIIHANAEDVAQYEEERLLKDNPNLDISIGTFGPVIGTHLGEKALSFGWVKK